MDRLQQCILAYGKFRSIRCSGLVTYAVTPNTGSTSRSATLTGYNVTFTEGPSTGRLSQIEVIDSAITAP